MSTDQAYPLTTVTVPDQVDVARSLAWRFVRRSTQSVLPLLGILWGMPTLLYLMVRMVDTETIRAFAAGDVSLKRLFFLLSMIAVPGLPLTELIKIRRLYTLPVTTRQIVHWQIGIGVVAVTAVHLLTVVYYRVAFSATIPIVGPLLFLLPGLLIVAGLAAFLADARLWKLPVAAGVAGVLAYLGVSRFDDPEVIRPGGPWFTPSLGEMLVLLTSVYVGYQEIRHAAARDRCGETRPWADVKNLWQQVVAWWTARGTSRTVASQPSFFRSATAAQASYEWWTRGLMLPATAACFGTFSLIGAYDRPVDWLQGYLASFPGLLFFGMFINGYVVGLMHDGKSTSAMDVCRATRPLTDTQLVSVAIRNGLRGVVLAVLVSLGLAVLVATYALLCGETLVGLWTLADIDAPLVFGGRRLGYAALVVTAAVLGWAAMGFNLSCVATGRHQTLAVVWGVFIIGGFGTIMATSLLSESQLQIVVWCVVTTLAFVAGGGTVVCYRAAVARGLIPPARCVVGGLVWTAASAYLLAVFPELRRHLVGTAAAIGLGALVALPLASAPLAVWWNRHR